ncbi:MAG: hypothetical protein COV78_01710, partial [Candidatus Pacebacteria bacterium CG11_big_fil_rev_8_21_14_0_20_34_55]
MEIKFHYKISPNLYFSPTLVINNVTQKMIDDLGTENIDSYVFNIGLAEMFSYWKSTASANIEVLAGELNQEQIDWWHKLLIKGMGEYFFVNNIKFTDDDFVKISSENSQVSSINPLRPGRNHRVLERNTKILIPIGGGKDSSVTLE